MTPTQAPPGKLVLLRHGQSTWNEKDRSTGWVDVGLTTLGKAEARRAGLLLREHDLLPEVVHTSVLRRAIRTANFALDAADRHWIPVRRTWRLNERHYGALQGRSKKRSAVKYGEEQLLRWRRSYDTAPPPLPDNDRWSQVGAEPYRSLPPERLPRTESLRDVMARLLPHWYHAVVPDLHEHRTVLVVAHGNSLRALVKHLDGISDEDIARVEIPTGIPLAYELDPDLRPLTPGGEYLDAVVGSLSPSTPSRRARGNSALRRMS